MDSSNTEQTDGHPKAEEPTATPPIRVESPSKSEAVDAPTSSSPSKDDADVEGEEGPGDDDQTVDTPTLTKALRRLQRLQTKQTKFNADVAAAAAVVEKERQKTVEQENANAFLCCVRGMDPNALDSFGAIVIAAARTVLQHKQAEAWIDAVRASRATETKEGMLSELPVRADYNPPATNAGDSQKANSLG